MQNNEPNKSPGRFRRMLKEKGYYIVLSLCIIAVGISGYVFVSTAIRQNRSTQQEALSVPVTITEPEPETSKSSAQSNAGIPSTETGAAADAAQNESAAASAEADLEDAAQETVVQEPVDWTVVQPVSGSIVQDYAMDHLTYNATTQDWRVHNGVDLAAELGQSVAAAQAGTVTAVYDDEYYGTTVVIQHDSGYTTHYCNLAETTAVAAGDTVAAGDVIGTIGGTALLEVADAPHLHFEVYLDGEPADPADFLS